MATENCGVACDCAESLLRHIKVLSSTHTLWVCNGTIHALTVLQYASLVSIQTQNELITQALACISMSSMRAFSPTSVGWLTDWVGGRGGGREGGREGGGEGGREGGREGGGEGGRVVTLADPDTLSSSRCSGMCL